MKLISSAQNPAFGELKKLLTSKGIHKQNRFFIWGKKFVDEILRESPAVVESIVSPEGHDSPNKAILLSTDLFKELDIFGTKTPFIVCHVPEIKKFGPGREAKGLELLVATSEPSNLGTIIRSAASFGVKKVILLKESASPFHPKSVRASAGNILKMDYELGPSIEELDPNILRKTFALDMDGDDLAQLKWPKNLFLLVGEEGRGIPKGMDVRKIQIKTEAQVESLNAATAISIAMYSYYSSL